MNVTLVLRWSAALALSTSLCAAAQAPASFDAASALSRAAPLYADRLTGVQVTAAPDGTATVTGQLDQLPFVINFPADWNGQAVLFAHGYLTPGQTEQLPAPGEDPSGGVLTSAYSQGFATAYSTYAKSGYAVKSGIESTYRLDRLLTQLGTKRAYIAGASMGGDITVGLIERYPNAFAGALPYCGVVAGWTQEQRYLADFRVVYDFFTKGTPYALPGAGAALTPNPDFTLQAVQTSVAGLFTAAAGDLTGPQAQLIGAVASFTGANPDPVSFITALAGNTYGLADYLETAGGNGYGNAGKVYASADPRFEPLAAGLNAGVERIAADPAAATYLNNSFTPRGTFKAKVLSFHNTIDPLVPYEFEPQYKAIVAVANNSANLVQQVVDPKPVNPTDPAAGGPAHCYFSPKELDTAWNELKAWVEDGTVPEEGKNITDK